MSVLWNGDMNDVLVCMERVGVTTTVRMQSLRAFSLSVGVDLKYTVWSTCLTWTVRTLIRWPVPYVGVATLSVRWCKYSVDSSLTMHLMDSTQPLHVWWPSKWHLRVSLLPDSLEMSQIPRLLLLRQYHLPVWSPSLQGNTETIEETTWVGRRTGRSPKGDRTGPHSDWVRLVWKVTMEGVRGFWCLQRPTISVSFLLTVVPPSSASNCRSLFIFSRIKKGEGQGKESVTLKLWWSQKTMKG